MKEIREKTNELARKSVQMRGLAISAKNYKKGKEIYEEQDKVYKKFLFFKNVNSLLEKVDE